MPAQGDDEGSYERVEKRRFFNSVRYKVRHILFRIWLIIRQRLDCRSIPVGSIWMLKPQISPNSPNTAISRLFNVGHFGKEDGLSEKIIIKELKTWPFVQFFNTDGSVSFWLIDTFRAFYKRIK